MGLLECAQAVRRRWWLLAAAIIAALAAAGAINVTTTPQYMTSVTFFVTTPTRGVGDAYQGDLFSQQRVKSYADLLTGDRLARDVADDPRVDLTSAAVQSRLNAQPVPDTVLLEATVMDRYPARSQRIAETVADRFVELVETLETAPESRTPAVRVEVVAGPLLNPEPVSPRPVRNFILGGLLGLLAGAAVAVLREALDTTLKTPEALRDRLDTPVLSVVPFDRSAKNQPLLAADAHSPRGEAIRRLRTNLQFVDVDQPVKVVMVTSALAGEGKTSTAVNLAISFAQAGSHVMLIEADLRRPRAAGYLGLEGAVGLSNVLAGQVELDDVLQVWGDDRLKVLPSGVIPPNPSELVGSRRMAQLLEQQREKFDIIIVDTPPLVPVTDAALVAGQADGALLVVRSGKTPLARVRTAVEALRTVNARIIGSVLNLQPRQEDSSSYYYDYAASGSQRAGEPKSRTMPRSRQEEPAVKESTVDDAVSAKPALPARTAR